MRSLSYIYDQTIKQLKEKGALLCRIIGPYDKFYNETKGIRLRAESIIHQYGYEVSEKSKLTQKQRQLLLENILGSGIVSE